MKNNLCPYCLGEVNMSFFDGKCAFCKAVISAGDLKSGEPLSRGGTVQPPFKKITVGGENKNEGEKQFIADSLLTDALKKIEAAQKTVEGYKAKYGAYSGKFMTEPLIKANIPLDELIENVKHNVVEIQGSHAGATSASIGSGCILADDLVVTNAHVILDERQKPFTQIYITTGADEKHYACSVFSYDIASDIAVLKFNNDVPSGNPRLRLRSCKNIKPGTEVFTIGNPKNLGLRATKGIISRAAEIDRAGKDVISTDMSVNHGNSGGALFDMNGLVLGLITYNVSGNDGVPLGDVSFAVTSDAVLKALEKSGK